MLVQFARYAAAFEEAYSSRDFAALTPFFTEDAEYVIHREGQPSLHYRGREAVLDFLAWITDAFDRRFAERKIVPMSAPRASGQQVEVHGAAVYTLDNGDRCHLTMTEVATFAGDRIDRLVDTVTPGGALEMELIVRAHPDRFSPDVLTGPAAEPVGS